MVGIAEVAAGLSSLKAAKDIIQGLNATITQTKINEVKIELQGLILEAQQGLFAAQEAQSAAAQRITDLEQDIVRLKDWEREKQRYQLNAIGPLAIAYTLKAGMENGEPAHWLCQPCFESGHKHALQYVGAGPTDGNRGIRTEWQCGSCGSAIKAGRNASLSDPSSWG